MHHEAICTRWVTSLGDVELEEQSKHCAFTVALLVNSAADTPALGALDPDRGGHLAGDSVLVGPAAQRGA